MGKAKVTACSGGRSAILMSSASGLSKMESGRNKKMIIHFREMTLNVKKKVVLSRTDKRVCDVKC